MDELDVVLGDDHFEDAAGETEPDRRDERRSISPVCRQDGSRGRLEKRAYAVQRTVQGGLEREFVGEVGENFGAVVGDEHEVFESASAEALAVQAGLDREDVPRDKRLLAGPAE